MKQNKATAKSKTGKTSSAKGNKNAVIAATETVEEIVQPQEQVNGDESLLNAPQDLTETEGASDAETPAETVQPQVEALPEGQRKCSTCQVPKVIATDFSPLASGKPNYTCKSCRTLASVEWTTRRADLRKEQAFARRLQNQGIAAIPPDARTWKAGDVILTVDGRDAREVWAELQATREAEKTERDAEKQRVADEIKAANAERRETERQAREAKRLEDKAARDAENAEKRELKAKEQAEKAAKLAQERADAAKVKADEKAAAILKKAQDAADAAKAKADKRLADIAAKAAAANAGTTETV
jgi:hypothetical protein